ncbi:TetR/AcrR family transcriptional regulator [Kineococcus rubinsiae]|uniref:TetR/AcrR family transcriptional regulator n=1 Tax=Kineococcus rubinsiae TaxID=2609562 RepID=UPI0014309C27|nr:TetR/AcrR family transcriptional regulator [Kineococcus rubinsiae]NIZ92651.1 TetR/AcrR family transcriptional regulator [Kineococcus rubinsiae]
MRTRILDAALRLLVEGGRDAVSTRAVTSAVGIQAPTLYRIFGDKLGLLDAVAAHGFAEHLSGWQGWQPGADPIDALRQGWDMHVQWGVENPQLYSIAYGGGRPGFNSPAGQAIDAILRTLIDQAALAGYLGLPNADAVNVLRAVGSGVVFTLIALPEDARDARLSERGLEAVLSTILAKTPASARRKRSGAAMQLKADLETTTVLTPHERALFGDWLDRLAGA